MKKQKSSVKRLPRSTAARRKRTPTQARPLHKRILLHPFSAMIMLCTGILIVGATFRGLAASYSVTATVSAPKITSPAIIVSPADLQHGTVTPIVVQGTCPAQSYVKLYRNAAFSGVSQCSAGLVFQIQTAVTQGANTLQARVFNATDDEGPQSAPITVYLDETTLPAATPPMVPPTTLVVSRVESGQYSQGATGKSSPNPTVSGIAPPFAQVVVTFHSDPLVCKTQANASGNWQCTLASALPAGIHRVEVSATTVEGRVLRLPDFQINVLASLASVIKPPAKPLLLSGDYRYQTYRVGQSASFAVSIGGQGPYQVAVEWGDGTSSQSSQTDGTFALSHTYSSANNYVVIVKATDAAGNTSLLQLSAVVKTATDAAAATSTSGRFDGLMSWIRQWLWVVWPLYVAVVLMAVSYWIGEQEAYKQLFSKRGGHRPPARK